MKLPNIDFVGDSNRFIEAKDDPTSYIMYEKDEEYFNINGNYDPYVKACEQSIRRSDDYKIYINWIKETLGINFCQVAHKIKSSKTVTVEMHHGPIFNLYDCVECAISYRLAKKMPISTFKIADQVLQDHFDLIIQTVMLAKTNHEAVHNRDIFLNVHQIIGNLEGFVDKYGLYFEENQKYKLYINMKLSEDNPSYDNGILNVDHIRKYFSALPLVA